MARSTLATARWGDSQSVPVAVGERGTSRELIRVEAPFPCSWRLQGSAQLTSPVNLGVAFRLLVTLGMGQAVLGPFPLGITINSLFALEVPGQLISCRFDSDPALGVDLFTYSLMCAPLTPWEGLSVNVSR